jgi:acyl transferase domain-containing protein
VTYIDSTRTVAPLSLSTAPPTDSAATDEVDGPTVLLFPGQGAYDDAALQAARSALLGTRDIFERIDAVAAGLDPGSAGVTDTVFTRTPPLNALLEESPDLLQLSIFGLSVAVHHTLTSTGVRPGALVGHSFGEISALVAGGVFTVEQGTALVCHRNAVLRRLGERPGAMSALTCSGARAEALLQLLEIPEVALAADNSPGQCVVSGSQEGLDAVARVAQAVPISTLRLHSPYAFHSPLMEPLVEQLAAQIRQITPGPLKTPVYSPILGRWYQDGDDYATLLASHLVRPVRFREALQRLQAGGGRVFVEAGARAALTGFVRTCAPEATTVTTLHGRSAADFPHRQIEILGGSTVSTVPPVIRPDAPIDLLLPQADPLEAQAFWSAHGSAVLAEVQARFDAFRRERAAVPAPVPAPVPALAAAPDPAPASVPPAAPAVGAGHPDGDRQQLFTELTAFYAEALEYPQEVFTEAVELEADLGVDSVKQTELIARVAERYGLPERPADFRLADYATLGRVTDFVQRSRPAAAAA